MTIDNLPRRDITREEARRRTDEFKVHTEAWLTELVSLHDDEVWWALGYISWDDYCSSEFGSIRLPRGASRTGAVLTMRQASLSIRDIGSALGLSRGTVQRELDTADPASLPDTIIGADGKERPASKSTVSVDDSEANVPNGTVDPETTGPTVTETPVVVDDSETTEIHRQWLSTVVAQHRQTKAEADEAEAKLTEAEREEERKHQETCKSEICLQTPQKLLFRAIFDAVLLDGVTDLDQVAADNRVDRDIAALAWAKCWRLVGEGTCVWCGKNCHPPAPDLDFHLAADPCIPAV